jgi:hypothetical protein
MISNHVHICIWNYHVHMYMNMISCVPQEQVNRLPPPRTLILDFTMIHTRFGRSNFHPIGQLTHKRRSDGAPECDGALKDVVRVVKILHYRQIYLNRPQSSSCPLNCGSRHCRPHIWWLRSSTILQYSRETSSLSNELPEKLTDQCLFP